MPSILLFTLITLWLPGASADGKIDLCELRLKEIRPTFEPKLRIHTNRLAVTYRGVTFALPPIEYELLKLMILAPNELIEYDDIIAGIWGSAEPENPRATVCIAMCRLRKKFNTLGAGGDKLKTCHNKGVYWARKTHDQRVLGRIGVAKFILEGYADGEAIPLTSQEHASLHAGLIRNRIHASSAHVEDQRTFKMIMFKLNRKFASILGIKPFISGPQGSGFYQLNPTLRGSVARPEATSASRTDYL